MPSSAPGVPGPESPLRSLRLLLNPRAGGGAALRRLPVIRRALGRAGVDHDVVQTEGPRDAARLVAAARRDGVDCLAVVGGDGTLNEVAQGYLAEDGTAWSGPSLALLPAGTGGDFRRSFGLSTDLEEAVARLTTARARPLDLGVVEVTAPSGARVRHAFINIVSFGLAGLVDRLVNEGPKGLGARPTFLLGTLRALTRYQNVPVVVEVDGEVRVEEPIVNLAVANAQYFGGGMRVAPRADPSDGLLDVVCIGNLGPLASTLLAGKIYQGAHLDAAGVRSWRGRRVEARTQRPGDECLVDMDGETPGRLPLAAWLLPGALRLRA